jgi:uncharacterized protein
MKPGDFVWYELCTPDPTAAAEFYAAVVGWTMQPSGLPGMDYILACLGDRQLAGIMTLPPAQMPPRPVWFGYVGVADVDAKAAEIAAAGGRIHKAPQDIPTIGRFAVVADPQGAVFILFKGTGEAPEPLGMMQTGSIGWHELHSSDFEKGWVFYERMFGWSKDVAHESPMGTYQLFKASGMPIGGGFTDKMAPHPYWLYYFVVDDIDAGVTRLEGNGGTLLHGPMEVPGGAWVIQAKDPQGGLFALVGMKTG